MKYALRVAFCFIITFVVFLPNYYAECTAEEKSKMVKLGMELEEIKKACRPSGKTEKNNNPEIASDKNNIIINVNQNQQQEQKQEQEQSNAGNSVLSNGHVPEKFFWEFGISYGSFQPEFGRLKENNKDQKFSYVLLKDKPKNENPGVTFFPISYFFDSLNPGSIGLGLIWLDSIGGNIKEDHFTYGAWAYDTFDWLFQFVLPHASQFIFIPYAGSGSGTGQFTAIFKNDDLSFDCTFGGDVNKVFGGIKLIDHSVFRTGSGLIINLMYSRYDSAILKSKKCNLIFRDNGVEEQDGYLRESRDYSLEYNVDSFSGYSASIGFMW